MIFCYYRLESLLSVHDVLYATHKGYTLLDWGPNVLNFQRFKFQRSLANML